MYGMVHTQCIYTFMNQITSQNFMLHVHIAIPIFFLLSRLSATPWRRMGEVEV